jgi:hypothetical protein
MGVREMLESEDTSEELDRYISSLKTLESRARKGTQSGGMGREVPDSEESV